MQPATQGIVIRQVYNCTQTQAFPCPQLPVIHQNNQTFARGIRRSPGVLVQVPDGELQVLLVVSQVMVTVPAL
jgi:hypothetical protein